MKLNYRDEDAKDFKNWKKQTLKKSHREANIKEKNQAHNVKQGEKILRNEEDTSKEWVKTC